VIARHALEELPAPHREEQIGPLALLGGCDVEVVKRPHAREVVTVLDVVEREGIAATGPLSNYEDDLLDRVDELQPLEEDQVDGGKAVRRSQRRTGSA